MSEKYPFGMTKERYTERLHPVLECDGNWDYYANDDETLYSFVPKAGSGCSAGVFGDTAHFLRWLTKERHNGKLHEPVFEKVELTWKGGRYYDARNWGCA